MVQSFFWAVLIMAPLTVLENLWKWLVLDKSGLDDRAVTEDADGDLTLVWSWYTLYCFVLVRHGRDATDCVVQRVWRMPHCTNLYTITNDRRSVWPRSSRR